MDLYSFKDPKVARENVARMRRGFEAIIDAVERTIKATEEGQSADKEMLDMFESILNHPEPHQEVEDLRYLAIAAGVHAELIETVVHIRAWHPTKTQEELKASLREVMVQVSEAREQRKSTLH